MKKMFQQINHYTKAQLRRINNRGVRSVLLGIILAFGLSMGASLIQAQVSFPAPADEGDVDNVQQFLGQSASLMSRIGSLAVGTTQIPGLIDSTDIEHRDQRCTGVENIGWIEFTCLLVDGGATFAHLVVNQAAYLAMGPNLPSVIVSSISDIGGGGTFSDGITRFIIDDVTGVTNDSMLVSGLGYFNAQGTFAPRNLTTLTEICAKANGTMVKCDASAVTYNWQVGAWGPCNGGTAGSCSGTYQNPFGGSCQGTYIDGGACGGSWETTENNPWTSYTNGEWCGWEDGGSAQMNCSAGINPYCHLNKLYHCEGGLEVTTHYCSGPTNQSACVAQNPACTWTPTVVSCAGPDNEADCEDQNGACSWSGGSTQSCVGPNTQASCTAQNPACDWTPGTAGTRTRTVVCKNNSGTTVADSVCIDNVGPKPATSGNCGLEIGL